jgi:hypothetical protein
VVLLVAPWRPARVVSVLPALGDGRFEWANGRVLPPTRGVGRPLPDIPTEIGPPLDARLAALAARQHGVVARWQLRALGLCDTAITERVAAGRLHRVHQGVYAVGHTVLSPRGRWMAAVLAGGPGAVLSHAAAGALWELRSSAATRIDITRPSLRPREAGRAAHPPLPRAARN